MAKPLPAEELSAIEAVIRSHPGGASLGQIAATLAAEIPSRTLQRHLRSLTENGRLVRKGERRWAKYYLPGGAQAVPPAADAAIPLSGGGKEVLAYVRQPVERRKPVGYDRRFLDAYHPNASTYLDDGERAHLSKIGAVETGDQPAGTYAKQILNRLLIDLSWNSSRLEGNTYSLLDTRRLIDFGEEAEGKERLEAQMILNHKGAIEFLVNAAEDIGFNRYTILNLHAILANNLLADEAAAGRLRRIAVGIEKSVFHPLEAPSVIEECFDQALATLAAIGDPFEQAFFVMVQLPYLQPFDDVNKRVSRLAANIPLVKRNLAPLSFTDVPRQAYTDAILGVYELRRVDLLKDLFIWAYERSAARYAAVRQSLGEPDPFRLRYRAALQEIVGEVVRAHMGRKAAAAHITSWIGQHIGEADRERFRDLAEREIVGLHEGNFARYRIRPSDFAAWQAAWGLT
ncbi:Fic family protein [Oleomonas cavernae]|uniref:Fic family protein n=1 Tax=Oleomonas cavernae TaxID=2320859 RepID=A0A418WB54_9PROT|nr:Fic family protein [Oleomonas cavernae]RJF87230.1 Fic family protein [Oleomonas cavernae]